MELMNNLGRFLSQYSILTSVLILSFGCSSIPTDSKIISEEITSIQENFKIEGKFKLSNMDSKETGYFVVNKNTNTVSLNIGKNYLLPERVIVLDIREKLDLNKFIEDENIRINLPDIEITNFLELFLGNKSKNLEDKGIGIKLEMKDLSSFPSRVYLTHLDFELLIIIKNIWKN